MILGDPVSDNGEPEPTLDALFRRVASRRVDAFALLDPPNRGAFAEGFPRRITYAEADHLISVAACGLRQLGLHTDDLVAIQLGNTVESVIALLAVIRAGLIAVPIPLLWRRAEAAEALGRVGAKAIITCARVGSTRQAEVARDIAAQVLSIQYVCGFGGGLPDGVVPLDGFAATDAPLPVIDRGSNPGAHLAVVTFDLSTDGLVPVARSHAELIAGGLVVMLEAGIPRDATMLMTLTGGSFATLATGIMPWLFSAGTLALHHPFDAETFAQQREEHQCEVVVLPGAMIGEFMSAGALTPGHGLTTVVGVWRTPERLPRAAPWLDPAIGMIDAQVFGETGILAARRGSSGKPAAIPFGPIPAPRGVETAVTVGEVMPTDIGTVALRGAMVPRHAFPPTAEHDGLPHLKVLQGGYVDTGYTCRLDRDTQSMLVTGPPAGIINVGGYRFRSAQLQQSIGKADPFATLAALPDALAGHRLAGTSPDAATLQQTLGRLGANPLVIAAFNGKPATP